MTRNHHAFIFPSHDAEYSLPLSWQSARDVTKLPCQSAQNDRQPLVSERRGRVGGALARLTRREHRSSVRAPRTTESSLHPMRHLSQAMKQCTPRTDPCRAASFQELVRGGMPDCSSLCGAAGGQLRACQTETATAAAAAAGGERALAQAKNFLKRCE